MAEPVEEIKEESKKAEAVWYDEKTPLVWKIRFSYVDENHKEIASVQFEPETLDPKAKVGDWLIPRANPKALELGWKDCWFWAGGFEGITPDHEFEDLNFMRKPDGSIYFMLEGHGCQKEAAFKPCIGIDIIEEKECVKCKAKPPSRLFRCLHLCLCDNCFEKTNFCPICRKKKPKFVPVEKKPYY